MHGVADPGGDVEVEQFRSCAGEHHVERLDIPVDQPFVTQFGPHLRLCCRKAAIATSGIQLLETRRIRMKSDESVEQVQGDIYCFPVAKMPVSGDELIERLSVDELGDEIPVAGAGFSCTEDV